MVMTARSACKSIPLQVRLLGTRIACAVCPGGHEPMKRKMILSGLLVLVSMVGSGRVGASTRQFEAPLRIPQSSLPTSVAMGDLNHDGIADLVTTRRQGLAVLLGDGGGAYQDPVEYAAGVEPISAVLTDLNGDGRLDLASGSDDPSVQAISIRLGVGDGTFGPSINVPTGVRPRFIGVGDFDSDGHPDLVTAN